MHQIKLKIMKKSILLFLLTLSVSYSLFAGNENNAGGITISGYVKDAQNGETMVGATVIIKQLKTGTTTNQYGFYSLSVPQGSYEVSFIYVGYSTIVKKVDLKSNITLNVEISSNEQVLDEVVITTDRPDRNIKEAEMSVSKLEMKTIRQIPALMGEVDVIKAIQMLPGVVPTAEGTSGFSVRGGGNDQNLIILDEAPVYNASHLMGFFSVFNNDAVRDVKLYKGDIPANFGGRLSSVLDVHMKEGNNKKFAATGGVGLISSRLTLEGPIVNEKTSFLISGRRTYADVVFFPLLSDSNAKNAILYFYDLNLKINHQFNPNNRLFLSAYLGRDVFGQKGLSNAGFGNKTATLRWNHQYSSNLFSNLTAIVSNYDYSLSTKFGGSNYVWKSNLLDYSLKVDFDLFLNSNNEIKFGAVSTYHELDPINAWIESDSVQYFPRIKNYELEHAFYIANEQKIGEKLTLKYGLRYSIFQNMGKSRLNHYDENHEFTGYTDYSSRDIYKTYPGWEPRLGLLYTLNDVSSVKASYSHTIQYLQLASVSNGGMPLDYWFPSSPNVKPQSADQYAIGYFRNFMDNAVEVSVESFYKDMQHVIDFKDFTNPLFNDKLDGDIRTGTAESYGLEIMLKKNDGKLNGWISYTLSTAKRKIPEINDGLRYSAPYDKPNNINIVLTYELTQKLSFSANWVYATGAPYTGAIGSYTVNNTTIAKYSSRNESRMRDYHRLDLSLTLKGKNDPNRLWHGEWVFSLYNAYGRHNDWMLNLVQDKKSNAQGQKQLHMERTYLPFTFFPGITYNFKFN